MRRIGVLRPVSAGDPQTESIRQGLRELGYVEGQNIHVDYRFAAGQYERLPGMAAELVELGVEVISTAGPANRVAKDATSTIPIVFALDLDPVGSGLVASLARPGGNVTGVSLYHSQLAAKRLEYLREVAPGALRVAVMANPDNSGTPLLMKELEAAARSTGVQLQWLSVQAPSAIPDAFAALATSQAQALLVADDAMFFDQRARLAELAAESRLPAMFANRGFAEPGGLMAYGPSLHDMFRRSATFVDKILQGAKPADLPVEQPTVFDFAINLKTAQALGLTIPQSVLQQATEIVQ
jgi:putative ABC transport system substrate-binding protein